MSTHYFTLHGLKSFRITQEAVINGSYDWESAMNKPIRLAWIERIFEEICFKYASAIRKELNIEHILTKCYN